MHHLREKLLGKLNHWLLEPNLPPNLWIIERKIETQQRIRDPTWQWAFFRQQDSLSQSETAVNGQVHKWGIRDKIDKYTSPPTTTKKRSF